MFDLGFRVTLDSINSSVLKELNNMNNFNSRLSVNQIQSQIDDLKPDIFRANNVHNIINKNVNNKKINANSNDNVKNNSINDTINAGIKYLNNAINNAKNKIIKPNSQTINESSIFHWSTYTNCPTLLRPQFSQGIGTHIMPATSRGTHDKQLHE